MNNLLLQSLRQGLNQVLYGKPEIIEITMTAALAGGHLLIEDVPGVGKTTLGKAVAQLLGADFQRIQFTADLMPSDLSGLYIYQPHQSEFVFQPGPIFCHVLLADEMNRASPKTQSSLLEAMGEGQVSIDRNTHILPKPFWVIATQNPISFAGTYPLPESQLDRFMLSTKIGYPHQEAEHKALKRQMLTDSSIPTTAICTVNDWVDLQSHVEQIHIDDDVIDYLLSIVRKTRQHEMLALGVSTRGALSWQKACQARALLLERDYVTPSDVQALAVPALQHRIWPSRQYKGSFNASHVVESILENTTLPYQK